MSIPLIMLVAYIALTLIVSAIIASRGKESSAQFLTAEGDLKWFLIIPLLFAEMMAGAATIGNAATGYTTGISAAWMNWGMAIGIVFFIAVGARFYRAMHNKYGVLSVPEVFKYMFDEKCRMVMLIIIVVVYCFLYSSQPISAAALISPMVGIDSTIVAWAVSIIFIAVTLLGGMKGLAVMNFVHLIVMYIGLVWCAAGSVGMVGGFQEFLAAMPADHLDPFSPDLQTTLANAIATAISFLTAATMVTAGISAKSPRDMAIGSWGAAIIIIPFATLPAIIGMCALVVLPGIDPNTALFSMAAAQGDIVSGVVSMAIAAAIWSSAPAALLFCANTLTQDFFPVIKPGVSDGAKSVFSKVCILVLGVLSTWLGLNAESILGQLYAAFQIRSVVTVTLLVALAWPRVSTTAAFTSMLGGGVVAAAWHFAGDPFGIEPLWPACLITFVIVVVVTLFSREKVSPGYKRYLAAKETLKEEGRSAA